MAVRVLELPSGLRAASFHLNDVTQLFASGAISSSENAALANRNSGLCGPAGKLYGAFIHAPREFNSY